MNPQDLHSLLLRQIRQRFGRVDEVPEDLFDFLQVVNDAYHRADADRAMIERSLEISSEELWEANEALEERVRDRTAALEAAKEAAEAASEAKSRFLANMSHEMRTPLHGVMGAAQLLEYRDLDTDSRRLLEMLMRSARALLSLIDDTLDLAKIEEGRLEFENVSFSPQAIVSEVFERMQPVAREKRLRLVGPDWREIPPYVLGDPTRLGQVLTNLMGNAIKFTRVGSVEVAMDWEERAGEKVGLRIEVRDSGVGVPEDKREAIFQRFQQADTSTTRTHGGSGLGLAISREIVERMGGRLELRSTEGVGSTFTVALELPIDRQPKLAGGEAGRTLGAAVDARVLLVEDNATNRLVARSMLAQIGCAVTCATNGREAVEQVREGEFDVVLMDCHMPTLDGFGATRQIRALGGARGNVPIVAMTASAVSGERERCLAHGMDDYLSKPVELHSLRAMLDTWKPGRKPS